MPLEPRTLARSGKPNCQNHGSLAGSSHRGDRWRRHCGGGWNLRNRSPGRAFRHRGGFNGRRRDGRSLPTATTSPSTPSASSATARGPSRTGSRHRSLVCCRGGRRAFRFRFWHVLRWWYRPLRCRGLIVKVLGLQGGGSVSNFLRLPSPTLLAALQALAHPFPHIALVAHRPARLQSPPGSAMNTLPGAASPSVF